MKVCFVSPEFFHWGVHGGFGYVTWTLSRELAKQGHDITVVTPRRKGQQREETVDGVKVLGYPPPAQGLYPLNAVASRLKSLDYYREADADIYHSEAVSLNTLAAQHAAPDRKHIITFQDPYDRHEWSRIAEVMPQYRSSPAQTLRVRTERVLLTRACRNADALYSQARFLVPRARDLFSLPCDPMLLPNPVPIRGGFVEKSSEPSVCFLARWDPQKRVELFFKLAEEFPGVRFIAMGHSHDPEQDAALRERYGGVPNLTLTGFVSEESKAFILGSCWALVNTSVREALPVSFLEALAQRAPIVSGENPDGLTERYGYPVERGDYSSALRQMLTDDDRGRKGAQGHRYIIENHSLGDVVNQHIKAYERVLEGEN